MHDRSASLSSALKDDGLPACEGGDEGDDSGDEDEEEEIQPLHSSKSPPLSAAFERRALRSASIQNGFIAGNAKKQLSLKAAFGSYREASMGCSMLC